MDGWAGKPQDFNMPDNLDREQTARGAVVGDCRTTGRPRVCGKIAALQGCGEVRWQGRHARNTPTGKTGMCPKPVQEGAGHGRDITAASLEAATSADVSHCRPAIHPPL